MWQAHCARACHTYKSYDLAELQSHAPMPCHLKRMVLVLLNGYCLDCAPMCCLVYCACVYSCSYAPLASRTEYMLHGKYNATCLVRKAVNVWQGVWEESSRKSGARCSAVQCRSAGHRAISIWGNVQATGVAERLACSQGYASVGSRH
jgi:hypothetical protein